jgi:hypothetical protein
MAGYEPGGVDGRGVMGDGGLHFGGGVGEEGVELGKG